MSIIRADSIKNRAGDGAPDFPNGITVTGIVTATTLNQNVTGVITATSFIGDGSSLTGIDATKLITGNTQVQTIDTGSDGHIKFSTEGTARSRVNTSGHFTP